MPILARRRVRKKRDLREELAREFLKGKGIELTSASGVAELRDVEDESQHYVAADQVLESCNNVLAALQQMHRVLKPGGVLFLTVTPSRDEEMVTPLGHLAADYVHGPDQPDGARQHVWTPHAWMELMLAVQTGLGMDLEAVRVSRNQTMTVLNKR